MVVNRQSTAVLCCILVLLFRTTFEQLVVPLSSRTERFALIQLRSSLGLRTREWPIKSDPCLIWVGIQCQNGRVVGINISGFKRTRIGSQNPQFAVESLGNFTLLESFNASKFSLPGSIPNWFGQRLKSLQVLDLRSCSITGAIPSGLGNLTNITALYLSDNSLSGIIPSSLGQLSRLSVLDLSFNSLTGSIPPDIGTLSNLQSLNLSSNNLSFPIPAQLGDLSRLVDLDLSFNFLSGSLPTDLRGLRNLQKMVIGNNLLAGSLPGNLFPPLTQLQFIILKHNDFTGDLPLVLWSMSELQFLDASGNNFTGALPTLSSNANAPTVVFNLSQNMFYGGLTSILRRFSLIDLSGNYFQGTVPDNARTNTSLDRNCLQNVSSQRTLMNCASFYAARGLMFDNFGLPTSTQPPAPRPAGKKRRTWIILVGVLGGVGFIAVVVIVVVILIVCNRKRDVTNQTDVGVGPVPTGGSPPPASVSLNFSSLGDAFTYQQILQATSDFNDVNFIKSGHSGDLFRGIIEGGIHVVIKRIDIRSVKKETYMLELDFFSRISHARLVPFVGHCLEEENEKFLIYKCMPNQDLSSSLYRKNNTEKNNTEDDGLQSLDWITRLKIAIGAAEGLSYLHHECTPPLVHRDIQASSILLDDKFEVRLGSLSEVCTQEEDARQNMITRLLRLPQTSEQGASGSSIMATCAYDVYCFGKVLLELVTGKLGISASSDATLEEILPYISIDDKELVTNIVDRSLIIDEDLLEEVWSMAIVARSCLNPKPSKRPLMRYVLKALENPLKVVREEHTSSARLRTTSSRGSWNAALFGSWRHSSSDVQVGPTNKAEGGSSYKQSGTTGSHGSGHSSSNRRQSNEIFPEPFDGQDLERDIAS